MQLNLTGKKVLVTGASQGIGQALAESFAREGCHLTVVARSKDRLDTLASDLLIRFGVPTKVIALDMTEPGAIEHIVEQAADIDILVNNAGTIPGGNLWDVSAAQWRAGWELKVLGYIDMTRAFYPLFKARGHGVIINNIGIGGENFDFDYVAGTTGNAALMAFTRAIGGRSLRDGIRVLGVNPGAVSTPRIEKVLKKRAEAELGDANRASELLAKLPLGRAATPEEIADLCVYLASDKSAYTSGSIFTVDGGITSARSIV
jgi:NAD(P)-dependent dehydrogenase (short-subunit alcohol dehydrogenase family)